MKDLAEKIKIVMKKTESRKNNTEKGRREVEELLNLICDILPEDIRINTKSFRLGGDASYWDGNWRREGTEFYRGYIQFYRGDWKIFVTEFFNENDLQGVYWDYAEEHDFEEIDYINFVQITKAIMLIIEDVLSDVTDWSDSIEKVRNIKKAIA